MLTRVIGTCACDSRRRKKVSMKKSALCSTFNKKKVLNKKLKSGKNGQYPQDSHREIKVSEIKESNHYQIKLN